MSDARCRPHISHFGQAAPWTITHDYVRNSALELLCREVEECGVPGALAELGVFRGDFAWLMSSYLPDRPIHLFDTFEGFDQDDVRTDASENLVDEFIDFSFTSPESVVSRFSRPELVHVHPGWFPATATGIDEQFALVSIDADLYEPVLSGLRWFYDRLSEGGAIMLHDFNNQAFGGAKKAARAFQEERGVGFVPLPDWGGTAVFIKSPGRSHERDLPTGDPHLSPNEG
jgi:O-methyltransferase